MKTLLFGYGNVDREDDGVAWHILREVMRRKDLPVSDELDIEFQDDVNQVDYIFQLQLTPELAVDLVPKKLLELLNFRSDPTEKVLQQTGSLYGD